MRWRQLRDASELGRLMLAVLPAGLMLLVAFAATRLVRAAAVVKPVWPWSVFVPQCFDATAKTPAALLINAGALRYVTTSIVHIFACFASIVIGISLLIAILRSSTWLSRTSRSVIVLLAIAIAVSATCFPDEKNWPFTLDTLNMAEIACSGVRPLLLRQERASALAAGLLIAVIAVALYVVRDEYRDLAQNVEYCTWVLYTGSLLMAASVLRLYGMYGWIVSLAHTSYTEPTQQLGESLTQMWAACYSLFLTCVYLPSYAVLRHRAARLVPSDRVGEAADQWLRDHGLGLTIPQVLARILAVLGPIISGEAAKVVDKL